MLTRSRSGVRIIIRVISSPGKQTRGVDAHEPFVLPICIALQAPRSWFARRSSAPNELVTFLMVLRVTRCARKQCFLLLSHTVLEVTNGIVGVTCGYTGMIPTPEATVFFVWLFST